MGKIIQKKETNTNKTIHTIDRRRFLTIAGVGGAIAAFPIMLQSSAANAGTSTTTIYFLNPNWKTVLHPAPYNHTKCKGKACHMKYPNSFYTSAAEAENSRLHICCVAPVQSRTIALSKDEIDKIADGTSAFDIRNPDTIDVFKDVLAQKQGTTPNDISLSSILQVLGTEISSSGNLQNNAKSESSNTNSVSQKSSQLPVTGSETSSLITTGITTALIGGFAAFCARKEKLKNNNTKKAENL